MPKKKSAGARSREPLPLPANDEQNYQSRQAPIMVDSYSNPAARIGDFTPNLSNGGQYPIVRLTENYPLILSLYRSSWIVRKIIDTIANDMYQSFPIIDSDITPEQIKDLANILRKTQTLQRLRTTSKWGRLFGGAGAIIVLDGVKDLSKPLNVDDVEVGSYKGLIPLDRWSGIIPGPEINSDIEDPRGFGLPTYYNCIMDAGNVNIHHSRILRFPGRELPQWEVQVELYWGMSEVELIFDELKKRDYSSWNIISLFTRAQVLSITEPQLATLMSGAGGPNAAYTAFAERMEKISQLLNNQGLMILGKDGKLESSQYSFGGMSDIYHEFMKDVAAACEIPYEIIFGRESSGGGGGNYSSNGQSSLQLYDNLIEQKRASDADPIIDQLLPIICMSTWGVIPDNLSHHWAPIRSLSVQERYDLGKSVTESVLMAYNADLITKQEARKELAQQSGTNGLFSNITDESIAETPDEYASEIQAQQQEEQMAQQMAMQAVMQPGGSGGSGGGGAPGAPAGAKAGEHVPVEAKPIGVQGLKWHKSKRLEAGAGNKTSAASMKQSMRHGVKHEMKNKTSTFSGTALGMAEQQRKAKP